MPFVYWVTDFSQEGDMKLTSGHLLINLFKIAGNEKGQTIQLTISFQHPTSQGHTARVVFQVWCGIPISLVLRSFVTFEFLLYFYIDIDE